MNWEKGKALILRHYDILMYLILGVLTTAVNYLVYLPCYNILKLSAGVSNLIAWGAAVIFAFVTNKPLVFKSRDWSAKTVLPELTKFVGCRIGSGLLETLVLFVAVDCLRRDGNWVKLVTGVLVIVLNYFGSKLLVFRKKS